MDISALPPYRGSNEGSTGSDRELYDRTSLGGSAFLVTASLLVLAVAIAVACYLVVIAVAAPAG